WFFRKLCCVSSKKNDYPPLPTSIANSAVSGDGCQSGSRASYRLQVIQTLVQRYIETSRQEFAEKQRKGECRSLREENEHFSDGVCFGVVMEQSP
ncbi:hypothetical protein chiPu_0024085, partial [Chiloscyllium punctatum]|nr:hypothetical protein [Chiloscyllium punctatum]